MTETEKITIEGLEQAIDSYKVFAEKAEELPHYAQMAILPAFIETLPEEMQKYAHQMLGVKYAQEAQNAAEDGKYGDAAGYSQLAKHYMREGGIEIEGDIGNIAQNIKEYFKEPKR